MKKLVQFTLNGNPVKLDTEMDQSLLWFLRGDMELTGTKYGCGVGLCGACTVLVDGTAQRACMLDLNSVSNKRVTTIEGLAGTDLHPLQKAWLEEEVPQCGYCQPGQLMTAAGLLNRNPNPSEKEIVAEMSDVLCRCGTYLRIKKAVAKAAKGGKS